MNPLKRRMQKLEEQAFPTTTAIALRVTGESEEEARQRYYEKNGVDARQVSRWIFIEMNRDDLAL